MDAIRKDVADDNDDQEQTQDIIPGSPAARRMEAMDMIGKGRVAKLSEEIGAPVVADETPVGENPDKQDAKNEDADDPEPSQVDQQLAADDFLDPAMLNRKVRIKVDGEERVVPLEQVLRTAQKAEAVDRRLQEATELLRNAQAAAQQGRTNGETTGNIQPSAGQNPPGQAPQAETDEAVRARLKAAINAVFSGDEDAATDAFIQAIGRQQPAAPQIDPDQLADVVTQKVNERRALESFLGAYPRIAENPWLQAAADAALANELAGGKPFADALEAAGQSVYQQFGYQREQTAPKAESPTTNRREALEARKAGMDVPTGRTVSAAQTRVAPESSEAARSMTIADMAAARRGERPQAGR
ncbi:MAG: hypothetical protein WC322_03830 [Candidatus Paceibacterota bacterium]|jgi:hypothetical protein